VTGLLAYGADSLLGERGLHPHPVEVFGRYAGAVERVIYGPSRARGALHAALTVLPVAAAAQVAARRRLPKVALLWAVLAGRSLREAGARLAALVDQGDIEGARRHLRALCGRDPDQLDAAGLLQAGVESVAENTVDAVVAPLFWAAVAGVGAAVAHRAVNTLDAMVGHRSARYGRFGWAAARLDDAAAWIPARVLAGLVALLSPGRPVWEIVRRDAPAHPSPNAGVAEASFAAALGVRLGGRVSYEGRWEDRPVLYEEGRSPGPGDLRRAVRLSGKVGAVAALGMGAWR
jgi:adenosylcobinamide-phosphate synthase